MTSSVSSLSSAEDETQTQDVAMRPAPALTAPTTRKSAFSSAVTKRRKLFHECCATFSMPLSELEPLVHLPQATSTNCAAMSGSSPHLFTGGSDGFIRKYDALAALKGSPEESTSRYLASYWANADSEEGLGPAERLANAKFGPRANVDAVGSPVHSLLVEKDEMYALAGGENGSILFFGVRLDEGQCRHVFKSSTDPKQGHKQHQAVSSLIMSPDDQSFISAGWDANVLQWDLNTGQVLRRYEHATGQITSLSFRPIASTPPSFDASISSNDPSKSSHQATKTSDLDPLFDEDAEGSSTDGGGTEAIAESLVVSPKKPGSAVVQLPGVTPLPKPSRPKLPRPMDPSLPALSTDVLLGSCIDGTVMLWDRRVANGTVRAFTRPKSKAPWAMTAAWSPNGNEILVGRRSECVDIYDLRAGSTQARSRIRFPAISGAVTALLPLADDKVLAASCDNLRILDRSAEPTFQIIPGHVGGPISTLLLDPLGRFLVSAVGHRGWADRSDQYDGVQLYGAPRR